MMFEIKNCFYLLIFRYENDIYKKLLIEKLLCYFSKDLSYLFLYLIKFRFLGLKMFLR